MKLQFLTCAQSAVIDESSNNLSILNVIEEASVAEFPMAAPVTVVALVSRTARESESPKLKLQISLAGETKKIFDDHLAFSFQGKLRSRIVARFQGVVIPGPGTVTFTLVEGKKELGSWGIKVAKSPTPPQVVASRLTTEQRVTRRKKQRVVRGKKRK